MHSATREAYAQVFRPTVTTHRCRYIWLAADFAFDAFRFEIAETEHGVMQLHGYPYAARHPTTTPRRPSGPRIIRCSTVIVEMREEVWRAAGLDRADERESVERCAKLFADALGGRPLRSNNSTWTTFRTVVNERWSHGNLVLLGDAAHTAHFSIGSGTKLAVEDALALAACLEEQPDQARALTAYEEERRPVVASTQRAARASLEWFENLGHHLGQPPRQFAFNLLTRSRRVTHDNLRLRDAALHRRRGAGVRLPTRNAPDVHPVPAARPDPAQPRRRVPDGHVLGDRRCPRRLPPRPSGRPCPRRRRARDDRDGVREPRGAHHARAAPDSDTPGRPTPGAAP